MKWLRNFTHIAKTLSLTLSTTTMVMAPLAQGAEAAKANKMTPIKVVVDYSKYNWNVDKTSIQAFMKKTGLGGKNKQTVGEYYQKVRTSYPESFRIQMDAWVQANRGEFMPDFQVSTFQDNQGKEQIRLQVSAPGQSATISYAPESKDKYIKFNNTYLARTDMLYPNQALLKLAQGDKMIMKSLAEGKKINPLEIPLKLSYAEYKRLTPVQRASYLIRIRELLQTAEMVNARFNKTTAKFDQQKLEYFVQLFMGQEAEAARPVRGAKPGDKCIINGYVSVYGENYSCGGTKQGALDYLMQQKQYGAKCPPKTRSCIPLLYIQKNGSDVCISNSSEFREATSGGCPNQSPLDTAEHKQDLLNAYLIRNKRESVVKIDGDGKSINKKNFVNEEDFKELQKYVDDVNAYVKDAVKTCGVVPLSTIQKIRDEQASACAALPQRMIDVTFYDSPAITPIIPIPPPPPPAPQVVDCEFEKPGSVMNEGECVCMAPRIPGSRDTPERGMVPSCNDPNVVIITNPPQKETTKCADDETKNIGKDGREGNPPCIGAGFISRNKGLIIGAGIGLGLLAIFFAKKPGDSTPKQPPFVDPCGVATLENMALCHPPVVTPPPGTPPVQPPPIPTVSPTVSPTLEVILSPVPIVPVKPDPVIPDPVSTVTTETTTNPTTSGAGGAR